MGNQSPMAQTASAGWVEWRWALQVVDFWDTSLVDMEASALLVVLLQRRCLVVVIRRKRKKRNTIGNTHLTVALITNHRMAPTTAAAPTAEAPTLVLVLLQLVVSTLLAHTVVLMEARMDIAMDMDIRSITSIGSTEAEAVATAVHLIPIRGILCERQVL